MIKTIAILQKIFSEHDKDNSGTMDMYEMRSALSKQGKTSSRNTPYVLWFTVEPH